ncbi:hypothetical protein RND71_034915 [Anisodus tanguticus]|uniref:Uncharacterized protein n=1 Tax=Anisodus tanguticus TaxID=243964 RepID=A0AAE1V124_9SOLA|nr:hypothetical protein RND71_034915 [Anisodus tanguticus]
MKSRLIGAPEQDQRSQNAVVKSGVLLKDSEIEEEDPFSDEDLLEEYKKVERPEGNRAGPSTLLPEFLRACGESNPRCPMPERLIAPRLCHWTMPGG